MKYSAGFKNNVLKKVLPPENRPISEVCKEAGVSDQKIWNWLNISAKIFVKRNIFRMKIIDIIFLHIYYISPLFF